MDSFIKDCLEKDGSGVVFFLDIISTYNDYFDIEDPIERNTHQSNNLKRELIDKLFGTKCKRVRSGEKRKYGWYGWSLLKGKKYVKPKKERQKEKISHLFTKDKINICLPPIIDIREIPMKKEVNERRENISKVNDRSLNFDRIMGGI